MYRITVYYNLLFSIVISRHFTVSFSPELILPSTHTRSKNRNKYNQWIQHRITMIQQQHNVYWTNSVVDAALNGDDIEGTVSTTQSSFDITIRSDTDDSIGLNDGNNVVNSTKDIRNRIPSETTTTTNQRRVAVLVCPAQFCVPIDYDHLFILLKQMYNSNNDSIDDIQIGTCLVCDLPRTEWIKVAQQLPTLEFINAQLPVEPTLYWYFNAIEQGLAKIIATEQQYNSNDDNEFSICIIGHSIGGWVARAYLGGLSLSSSALYEYAKQRISSFITLGTPHLSPSTALLDQTRGLIAAIEASSSCSPQALIEQCSSTRSVPMEITCVCSSAVQGNILTTNVEELVAASSYLPLTGKAIGVVGDGIVPYDLAFLDLPAKRLVVKECARTQQPIRHCHVLPTPWNLIDGYAPSIALSPDTFPSYVSDGVIQQWAHCIR
jgi:hypothetical protein